MVHPEVRSFLDRVLSRSHGGFQPVHRSHDLEGSPEQHIRYNWRTCNGADCECFHSYHFRQDDVRFAYRAALVGVSRLKAEGAWANIFPFVIIGKSSFLRRHQHHSAKTLEFR